MARSVGRTILSIVFALLALNAWAQGVLGLVGESSDPALLIALQAIIGATAAATAWSAWTGARWAAWAALAYGLVTAGMIVSLGPILDLSAQARSGLPLGAVVVLAVAALAAWYLRRRSSVDAKP